MRMKEKRERHNVRRWHEDEGGKGLPCAASIAAAGSTSSFQTIDTTRHRRTITALCPDSSVSLMVQRPRSSCKYAEKNSRLDYRRLSRRRQQQHGAEEREGSE